MRDINKIVIHCSDSDNRAYDFERIYIDHTKHYGWSDIGYHIGVDFDGKVHILRPIIRPGAHTKGENHDSIGICLLGRDNFNVFQLAALANITSMFCFIFDLTMDDVYPHNHFNKNKTCPRFNVEGWKQSYLKGKLCH